MTIKHLITGLDLVTPLVSLACGIKCDQTNVGVTKIGRVTCIPCLYLRTDNSDVKDVLVEALSKQKIFQ